MGNLCQTQCACKIFSQFGVKNCVSDVFDFYALGFCYRNRGISGSSYCCIVILQETGAKHNALLMRGVRIQFGAVVIVVTAILF